MGKIGSRLTPASWLLLVACRSGGDVDERSRELRAVGGVVLSPSQDISAPDDTTVDVISTFISNAYYADTDIKHSFQTTFGERVDCIEFAAQPAVRALVAAGGSADPPPLPPAPLSPAGLEIPTPGEDAFLGTEDSDGNTRSCDGTTVPMMRPTVGDVQNAGGVAAFLSAVRRPHPRDSLESTAQWSSPDLVDSFSTLPSYLTSCT